MAEWLTPQNIMFVLGLLGIIFSVYLYFRTPQEVLDKRQAVDQKETDGKAALLAQQLQWNAEATERRFQEMGTRITEAMALAQNHIHTIDTKVETLNTTVAGIGIQVATLGTIIEERIPKR